ncbi:Flagellar hook-length control protein FliK [Cronobacter dublinensis 1210]|uniref:Flagellar hook-length control protein FliK n=1 Tax=Cronobacter dublinensis 1210 TaxID=1208656 RepID=A0ABP1WHH8_9ENTR|nr:flagellar hook length control protein FliK [Cronobacter dublinensis]EGT5710004.1 flagellar hook length control protein FliK [Cronobacter dublinensis subsp. dublinensis]CCJ83246.1 Flagellar hook-length control protein FliK [Cronobacter dublinensis 1210]ALB67311.1 flagellar hook-length control protein [Cronobacter dublinensis subsp. dublinensis LMG 23823]EGT5737619.1 flagellar hook length control protein FliK [Cronobacter dublinensis subsp. dublinensis]MDI7270636.1 flagellar hook length contr
MITLPNVVLTSDVDATSPGAGLKGLDAKGGDAAQDFLALLGQHFSGELTLADGKTVSLAQLQGAGKETLAGKTLADATATLPGTQSDLTRLLDQLTRGDISPADLSLAAGDVQTATTAAQPTLKPAGLDDDKKLSDEDMAALSALFAMLPPAQQPNAAPAVTAQTQAQGVAALGANGFNPTASLTQALGSAKSDAKTSAKSDDAATPLTAAAATAPVTSQTATDVVAPVSTLDKTAADVSSTQVPHNLNLHALSSTTQSQQASAPVMTMPTAQVTAPFGTPDWQNSVSQHISLFTRNGQQSAELHLHPEELGAVQISLKLDDNMAQIQMVSPHSHVRAALEAALPTLRTQLAESGIQLGQSNISSENFSGQQQQNNPQQSASSRGGNGFSLGGEEEAIAAPASLQAAARGNGAVDIFA